VLTPQGRTEEIQLSVFMLPETGFEKMLRCKKNTSLKVGVSLLPDLGTETKGTNSKRDSVHQEDLHLCPAPASERFYQRNYSRTWPL